MAQNIYDEPGFLSGYLQLDRSVRGLKGAAEWPAIRALLPDLEGRRIVDLGCGLGWFARWAKENGAAQVLGLDLSQNMIGRARSGSEDPKIEYAIADLERLELPAASFELACSSLALHYIVDFERLVWTVHCALTPGSWFIFTIEHPIYMAPSQPGWLVDSEGGKRWPIDGYSVEGPRTTDWLARGVVKQHRTIGTTLNTLIGAGFTIRQIREWSPTDDQVSEDPDLAEERDRPMILVVATQRQVLAAATSPG